MSTYKRPTNAKHYCEICKKWMNNDTKSIRFHENSNGHKYHLNMMMRRKQKERRAKQREIRETEKIVRMAERAAGVKTSSVPFRKKPDQRRRPKRSMKTFEEEVSVEEEKKEVKLIDENAQYEVDGKIYVQVSSLIENRIGKGVRCEIFSEESDTWIAAKIVDADRVSKRFRVALYVPEIWTEKKAQESGKILFYNTETEETQSEPPIVEDVRSVFEISEQHDTIQNSGSADPKRRCRLSTHTLMDMEYDNIRLCPAKLSSKSVLDVTRLERERDDVSSMVGGWETVEIKEPSPEENKKEEEVVEYVNAPRVGETDAYKAMNPFGGAYRGVDIEENETTEEKKEEEEKRMSEITKPDVQFRSKRRRKKKRRAMKAPSDK